MQQHSSDEPPPSFSLLCSACYTPCSGADAHVIPSWNASLAKVVTTYRCANCWLASLTEFRASLASGAPEIRMSFCDFLERQRFSKDAARLRAEPPDAQLAVFDRLLDALVEGRFVFDP